MTRAEMLKEAVRVHKAWRRDAILADWTAKELWDYIWSCTREWERIRKENGKRAAEDCQRDPFYGEVF